MEGDGGVSRSVRARKKAIETQWLRRVLETGQVREDGSIVFTRAAEIWLHAMFRRNYPPDGNVLQGAAEPAAPHDVASPFPLIKY
jgi:hypothetical protein